MRCERGHSITFRDRGPGRIHMANHGKPMKSCRVQFVVRNRDTKDKTLQINSVECKIYNPRRITNKISQVVEFQLLGLFLSSKLSFFSPPAPKLRSNEIMHTCVHNPRFRLHSTILSGYCIFSNYHIGARISDRRRCQSSQKDSIFRIVCKLSVPDKIFVNILSTRLRSPLQ